MVLAAMAAIGYGISGKKQKMAGVLAGFGIGIVALGGSCFAVLTIDGALGTWLFARLE